MGAVCCVNTLLAVLLVTVRFKNMLIGPQFMEQGSEIISILKENKSQGGKAFISSSVIGRMG